MKKGTKHSPETIEKQRQAKLGKKNPLSEKSNTWKGDNVGYRALHQWVRKYLPEPEVCQICKVKPPRDLANKTGVYGREFHNWFYLCVKCHAILDKGKKVMV